MPKTKLRVALIYGGTSKEREVSLISGQNVFQNLDRKKYKVEKVEVTKDPSWIGKNLDKLKRSDVAFLALHGPGGEDGTVQGLLDLMRIPYTCSGTATSALAMDKVKTKTLAETVGVTVAPHIVIEKNDYINNPGKYWSKIRGKVVIKPNRIGSSFGVTITNSKQEIKSAIKKAFIHDSEVIVEKYISGKEFTVPVLGNNNPQVLPVIAIVPKNGSKFFDFKAKYDTEFRDEIVPAPISQSLTKRLQKIGLDVHKLLGCRGVSRSDLIATDKGEIYFLEINTITGLTSTSLVPQSAAAVGMSYPKFLDKLIQLAFEK